MARNPSYEELERRIKEFEAESAKHEHAENALKESENKFRATFEGSHDAITLISKDGRLLDCNRRAVELFGVESKQDLLERIPADFSPQFQPDGRNSHEASRELIRKVLQEGGFLQFEWLQQRKTGEVFPAEVILTSIRLGEQEVLQASIRDITKRQRAQEEFAANALLDSSMLEMHTLTFAPESRILDSTLEAILKTTQSAFSFLGLMDETESVMMVHRWSKNTMAQCAMDNKPIVYPISEAGLWADCIRHRKPTIVNDYEAPCLNMKGIPEGHVPIRRFLSVPVFDGERIVAVGAVANKDKDYMDFDVKAVTALTGKMWDILNRKWTDEALRKSEEKYRILVENAEEAICVAQEGMLRFVNSKTEALIGYTREELTSRPFIDFVHPEDRAMVLNSHIERQRGAKIPSRYAFKVVHRSGDPLWVELSVVLIDWEGKHATLNFLSNITERKKTEERLKYRSEFERLIFQISESFIEAGDFDYKINTALELTTDFFQADRGYLFQVRDDGITIDNTHEWCAEGIKPQIANSRGIAADTELPWFWKFMLARESFQAPDVHDLPPEAGLEKKLFESQDIQSLVVVPILSRFTLIGFVGFDSVREKRTWSEDVVALLRLTGETIGHALDRKKAEEEREKLQAQLNQAQKMESVGRLAGGVAHDFNNMLQAILGHMELAQGQVDPAQPIFADLQEIRKAAERSADLVRQLLAFARKQTINPKVLDLNDTVEGMLKMLRRLIGEDIDLAWLPGHGLWTVKVDPGQIDQILANLAVNARDAISGVGKVTIETGNVTFDDAYCREHTGFVPGEYVLLAVSDNGVGMGKDLLEHLFEPFFTTKEIGKGTGLGLATVYGIVKQNNGFINVYSEPGHGTTVKIYLPPERAKTGQMRKDDPVESPVLGRETILLVEDEPTILNLTTTMLARLGYIVLAARTPGEAIRLAGEHTGEMHLLMTDVVMPEMNGRDLAKKLMALCPDIKRLFMSGYTADVIAHHGVLDEGVHFIQKPFLMRDLASKVREALDSE